MVRSARSISVGVAGPAPAVLRSASMAEGGDKRDSSGCLYVILMPIGVALVAGGDGHYIIAGVAIVAIAVVLIVSIGNLF